MLWQSWKPVAWFNGSDCTTARSGGFRYDEENLFVACTRSNCDRCCGVRGRGIRRFSVSEAIDEMTQHIGEFINSKINGSILGGFEANQCGKFQHATFGRVNDVKRVKKCIETCSRKRNSRKDSISNGKSCQKRSIVPSLASRSGGLAMNRQQSPSAGSRIRYAPNSRFVMCHHAKTGSNINVLLDFPHECRLSCRFRGSQRLVSGSQRGGCCQSPSRQHRLVTARF
jgi:hypothetical protein